MGVWQDISRHDLFARVAEIKLLSRTHERIKWSGSCIKEQETCPCYFTSWTGKIPLADTNPQQYRNGIQADFVQKKLRLRSPETDTRRRDGRLSVMSRTSRKKIGRLLLNFPPIFRIRQLVYRTLRRRVS